MSTPISLPEEQEPQELKVDETSVVLKDEAGKELEYETVGHMEMEISGEKSVEVFINAYVPTKPDGTEDPDAEVEYVVTDKSGVVIDDDEVQKNVVDLFVSEVLADDKEEVPAPEAEKEVK